MDLVAILDVVQKLDKAQESFLHVLLSTGVNIAGGYPLWLAGGSPEYSDIDLYPTSWESYYRWHARFAKTGTILGHTPVTTRFVFAGEEYQLVHPERHQSTPLELITTTDLSPCACCLVSFVGELKVRALYPNDIKDRICRVLIEHDWTPYRTGLYEKRGYTIVREES